MSKLGFAPVAEAYSIGSQQIKTERDEIARLKNIILEASKKTPELANSNQEYRRIGLPDKVNATFCSNGGGIVEELSTNDIEYTFLKLMRNPNFEEVVKNYIIFKHPEWLLSQTEYVPSHSDNNFIKKIQSGGIINNYKETFGSVNNNNTNKTNNTNNTNTNLLLSDIKNYVIFFIISMSIYLVLSMLFK